ncbi:MAG: hypothetical protein KY476_24965 [Planctomycetes bacterium]|nr:hypothetical protein [Planctomycetota bacterium]
MTSTRPTAETPSLLHERLLVYAANSRAIASGEPVGPHVLEIERNEPEEDEPISLSLFDAGDVIFGNAEGLGRILDEDRA